MPNCVRCGQKMSGFSIGSAPATECKECRKITAATTPAVAARFQPTVTITLIALNALVYLAMGVSGVSWTEPSIVDAVRWGADFGALTVGGEWWRALSSTFVHFGIIHIGFNMWCLWSLGSALELYMGRKAYTVIYFLSGLMASLTSIAWNPWRVSAGASGAIFGVAGAFVSYLYFKKAPMDPQQVRQKIKSLLIFIGYNLVYGAAGSVDNSAHMGGLVAGLILGSLAPAILRRADIAMPAADLMAPNAAPPATPSAAVPMIELAPEEMSHVDRVTGLIAVGGMAILLAGVLWIHGRNIPGAHYGKAIRLVQAGQVKEGIAELDQAVSLDPKLFFPSTLLGELQLQQGNADAAVPALERSAALAPGIFYVEQNLALAYLGVGRPEDALREIGSAMQHAKAISWRAQYIMGLAAEESGNSQLATDSFKSVIQSNPDFREAREALARLSTPASGESAAPIPFSELVFKSPAWPVYP